jgi:hypothetical protein
MVEKNFKLQIKEARSIANELNNLLREDSLHRLDLYLKYAHDPDATKWTPDLYHRSQLAEALCRKLDNLINKEINQSG